MKRDGTFTLLKIYSNNGCKKVTLGSVGECVTRYYVPGSIILLYALKIIEYKVDYWTLK